MQKLKTLIAIGTFKQSEKGMKIRMEEKSFEENMEQLEKIVTELEKGDLNLDESVKKFEQGMKISKKCNDILENAEKNFTITKVPEQNHNFTKTRKWNKRRKF